MGGTSSDWFQLFVTSKSVELDRSTDLGNSPFEREVDARIRCPLGLKNHVLGLNLLSQAKILGSTLDGTDFVCSEGLIGVRRGYRMPRSLLSHLVYVTSL